MVSIQSYKWMNTILLCFHSSINKNMRTSDPGSPLLPVGRVSCYLPARGSYVVCRAHTGHNRRNVVRTMSSLHRLSTGPPISVTVLPSACPKQHAQSLSPRILSPLRQACPAPRHAAAPCPPRFLLPAAELSDRNRAVHPLRADAILNQSSNQRAALRLSQSSLRHNKCADPVASQAP